jgi:hypothetical protein
VFKKTMVKVLKRPTKRHLLAGTNLVLPSTNLVLAYVTRLEATSATRAVVKSLVDNVMENCV